MLWSTGHRLLTESEMGCDDGAIDTVIMSSEVNSNVSFKNRLPRVVHLPRLSSHSNGSMLSHPRGPGRVPRPAWRTSCIYICARHSILIHLHGRSGLLFTGPVLRFDRP